VVLVPVFGELVWRERTVRMASACLAPVLVMAVLWATGSFQIRYAAGFSEKDLIREHWSPMSRVALMNYRNQQMYVIDNGSRTFYVPKNERTVKGYMRSLYTIPFEMKQGGDLLVIASGAARNSPWPATSDETDRGGGDRPPHRDGYPREQKTRDRQPLSSPERAFHIADGRSVVMRSKHRYDLIEMLDVNFATVAGQISLAWSPNFVSTQEAFSEYMEH